MKNLQEPKIAKIQQKSKCKLYDDRDEMINHIIRECSKLARMESKTRHDMVKKVTNENCEKTDN